MGFDTAKFMESKLVPRTKDVPVPGGLTAFFKEGEAAVWTVRSLDSNELSRAYEAEQSSSNIEVLTEALSKSVSAGGDTVEAVRRALGLPSKETTGDTKKRLELLVQGSVSPKVDFQLAVKLAQTFPIEFRYLTNTILELTGKGYELGNQSSALPETPDSTQACSSQSSEADSSTNSGPTSSPTTT